MKQILSVVTIAAAITACNPGPRTEDAQVLSPQPQTTNVVADTVGLAEYQAWKSQNELADFKEYQQLKAQGFTQTSNTNNTNNRTPVARKSSSSFRSSSVGNSTRSSSGTGNSTASTTPARKKGWSKTAKGAVIGAGTGAVVGAVVNKRNRAVGAVIGAVGGGAVGAVIGRKQDKQDGRY